MLSAGTMETTAYLAIVNVEVGCDSGLWANGVFLLHAVHQSSICFIANGTEQATMDDFGMPTHVFPKIHDKIGNTLFSVE